MKKIPSVWQRGPEFVREAAALKPKRSLAPAKKRREAKNGAERREWEAIRAAVFLRAAGKCECCGAQNVALDPDHMFGGSGRGVSLQSVYTVWALCRACHKAKGLNRPSASWWMEEFINHAGGLSIAEPELPNGYSAASGIARARLESLRIQQQFNAAPTKELK